VKDIALNAFELYAKVVLNNDDYKKKLDESESKFSKFAGSLKNGLKTAAKIGGAAIGVAATAVSALTKASIENYAEYEQLVGGVETLFKKSSDTVMKYAENAYKTAGLSANEYMETVTSFSASLLQSVGGNTEKAAKYADQAITDMADNANKMGSSMESIQNAYQGFAKQNYTMLDNLKLGYGGTKEEMQRLLKDAQKISGQKFDLSSYADVVQAIHVVQTEMGITGTTANEAATTISGSAGMMKASWQNLVTGIADDNADFDTLINNFVTSVTTFADNIIPRVQTALGGVGKLVAGLAPVIGEQIPVLVTMLLPMVIEGATSILGAVGDALPSLILSIASAITMMLVKLTEMLEEGLTNTESLDAILEATEVLIMALGDFLIKNSPLLLDVAVDVVVKLAKWLGENSETLTNSAVVLILALALGLGRSLPEIIPAVVDIITGIVDALLSEENRTALGEAAVEIGTAIIQGIWEAIKNLGSWFSGKLKGWFNNTMDDVKADQEIHSPSRLWARLIGKPIGQGVGEGAVEGLEESEKNIFYTFDKMSKKAIEKVEKLADEIKKRLDEIHGYFETTSDIAELEYEMWELTEGIDASEAEKAAKKIELLNKQLTDQKQIVDASSAAYEEMIKLYGEGSVEAMEYKKALLEEQVEYQKMQNELNETNKSYKQLAKSQRTWATVAIDAAKLVTSAFKETVQVSDAATTKNEKATSKISDDIKELISLFTSGKAKTAVSNARDLRSVSYG
jgi:hypothetical protein